jgi:hypothetical protein
MSLQEQFDFLNFWINKSLGSFYTVGELELILDRGSLSLYEDLYPKYATSQRIKDALAPFRATYNFTPSTTVSGYIVIPSDSNYLNLLDVQTTFQISNTTVYAPVTMVNEDERANRLNSQIDPVTVTSPIGEIIAPRFIRLYPTAAPGYTGTVTYFRRPVKPVFGYSVISGRVIVYNEATSTQLEWSESWVNVVLMKALSSIGINLSSQEIQQYAELKTQSNYQTVNMV